MAVLQHHIRARIGFSKIQKALQQDAAEDQPFFGYMATGYIKRPPLRSIEDL